MEFKIPLSNSREKLSRNSFDRGSEVLKNTSNVSTSIKMPYTRNK